MNRIIIICILFLGVSTTSKASIRLVDFLNYWVESVQDLDSLSNSEVMYSFHIGNVPNLKVYSIRFSDNGIESSQVCDSNGSIHIKTTPGKHQFQIYVSSAFYEILTDSLLLEQGKEMILSTHFGRTPVLITPAKPVIYLYPEEETDVEFVLTSTDEIRSITQNMKSLGSSPRNQMAHFILETKRTITSFGNPRSAFTRRN